MVILVVFNSFNVVKNLKKPDPVARQMPSFYITDVLVNADSNRFYEAIVVSNLIDYLRDLNQKRLFPKLHETMNSIFKDKMTDENFL